MLKKCKTSQVTTNNLEIGQQGNTEKAYVLYVARAKCAFGGEFSQVLGVLCIAKCFRDNAIRSFYVKFLLVF